MKTAIQRLYGLWESISDDIPVILAIGFVLGTFPVYGVPTLLCITAARTLRLNAVALLAVNQLATPVQLALVVPFVRVGWHVYVSSSSPLVWKLAAAALQAVSGWCLIALPAGILLHFTLLYILRRARSPQSPAVSPA